MQRFSRDFDSDLTDVEYYILKHTPEKQERLQIIRSVMKEKYPDSTERIYYGFPTVDLNGEVILQYAAYKKHISLLIGSEHSAMLREKYPQYHYTDYTVLFPDNEAFSESFIAEIAESFAEINRTIKPFKDKT